MQSELARATSAGVKVTFLATALGAVLQALLLLVMARLLEPQHFGLVALALVVLRPVQTLLFGGVERAVAWSREVAPEGAAGLFWVTVLLGALSTAACAVVARALEEQFPWSVTLLWMAPLLLLWSLAATGRGLLRARLQFGRLAVAELVSYAAGFLIVGLWLAVTGHGVESLVAAYITQAFVQALLVLCLTWHHPVGRLRLSASSKVVSYGLRISGMSFLESLFLQITPALVGAAFGAAAVGLFNRAFALAQLPLEQLASSASKVLATSFAAVATDVERLARALDLTMRLSGATIIPIAMGMAAAAPELVIVLLGEEWASATSMLSWLALAGGATMQAHFLGVVFDTRAMFLPKACLLAAAAAVLLVSAAALWRLGPAGVCASLFAARIFHLAGCCAYARRSKMASARSFGDWFGPGLLAGALCAASVFLTRFLTSELPTTLTLASQITVCAALCCGFYVLAFPALVNLAVRSAGVSPGLRQRLEPVLAPNRADIEGPR